MSTFTPQWGFEKPAVTTQNKTAVYNADLDRLDEGRRLKAVAGTTLGANLLTYVSSGRLLQLATGANRPLAGFVSSSGTAVTTVSSGSDVYAQVDGHIINSAWAFTPGLPVYAHPSAAGSITQTVPGSLAWPIAYAISSHQVAILPGGLHETHPTPEVFADLIITGTASVGGDVRVQSLMTARSAIVTEVASVGGVIASSRMATRHWGTTTPTGGVSGEIAVASGQAYVNDAGTWRAVSLLRSMVLVLAGAASGTNAGINLLTPTGGTIVAIKSTCRVAPTSTYTIDINKDGTTIYTTQANRPQRTGADGTGAVTHTAPDVTAFTSGAIFNADVDAPGAAISDPTFFIEYMP